MDCSNPTYGELLAGRQNSLIVDGASRFDPMGAASSFSVIGVSNTAAGGGDTETARYNTSLKYRIGVGPFHFAGLYQFGGFDQGNASNGAFSLGMTGDFGPLTFGLEGEKNKDAVSLSNFAQFPLPPGVSGNALKATLSNNTSGIVGMRYTFGNAALYSGWEYILFANPSDAYPGGFTAIGNYPVPAGFVNSTAYTEHKILRVFWTGVKYALRDNLDVAGAYYHYYQNDYNTAPCTDGGLSASSCRGALNAFSAMISYRPAKRVEAYGGFLWSQVTGGLASGYLYRVNFAPTVGAWKRLGKRRMGRPRNNPRSRKTTRRALRRSRKRGGTTGNEVEAVVRGADRARARRVRLCATVRPTLSRDAVEVQGRNGGRRDASSQRGVVAQLPRSDARRASGAGGCGEPRSRGRRRRQ